MSVKKILKELLEDNPDYSGRWDMDFKMDLQTKNHIRLVRLCQLLGFEDLYDDKKRQEYVQKMKSKMLKQEFISKVKSSQYFYTSVVYTRDQVNQINILNGRNERLLAIHCSPVIEHKPGASVMTIEHMELGEKAPLGVGEATELGYLLEKAATLIDELRRLRHKNEEK